MRLQLGLAGALFVFATSSGCSDASAEENEAPLAVSLNGELCSIEYDGQTYEDATRLGEVLEDFRGNRQIRLEVGVQTPWRCVGGPVFVLQSMGFEILSMVSPTAVAEQ